MESNVISQVPCADEKPGIDIRCLRCTLLFYLDAWLDENECRSNLLDGLGDVMIYTKALYAAVVRGATRIYYDSIFYTERLVSLSACCIWKRVKRRINTEDANHLTLWPIKKKQYSDILRKFATIQQHYKKRSVVAGVINKYRVLIQRPWTSRTTPLSFRVEQYT